MSKIVESAGLAKIRSTGAKSRINDSTLTDWERRALRQEPFRNSEIQLLLRELRSARDEIEYLKRHN